MIRILLRVLPEANRARAIRYAVLLAAVVVARATTCVLLVPLLGHLLSDDPRSAGPWVAVFAVVAAVHALLQHRLARVGFQLGLEVMAHVQHRLIDHVVELPIGWPTGARRATTQRALATTAVGIAQTVGNLVTPLAMAIALPVAIAVGLLFVAWPLGLAALAAAPLLVGAWWGANRCSQRADAAFTASVTELDDRIVEFARLQRALRGARRSDPDRSLVGEALAGQHTATVSLLRWSIPGELLFTVASQLTLLGLAVVALWLLKQGEVSVAESLGLIVVAVRFLEPFTTLGELAPALQATTTSLRTVDEILAAPTLTAADTASTAEGTTDGAAARAEALEPPGIRLEQVSFRHPGASAMTIDRVDLVAPAGATTAIVGPSGAGKSTLLGLIARFHDAESGKVLIDGRASSELDPADLYARMSFVFQAVHLFEGTIGENVRLGRPDATDAELANAAARARVDEIVDRLPAGWDTPVGEGGVALSGGERQRVGIARALLKDAPLLLVDEATSALDAENERAIAAVLAAGAGTRTTIVVAHRMHTIEQADHIVFVDRGRVVETGPREQLLASGGRFAEFHRDRRASATWTVGRGTD